MTLLSPKTNLRRILNSIHFRSLYITRERRGQPEWSLTVITPRMQLTHLTENFIIGYRHSVLVALKQNKM